MKKSFYIVLVSRDEDGRLNKVPVPLHYAYIFVAAAVVGLFTITGMAGSYSRMLLKAERFNQMRTEREALRKDYHQLEQVSQEKDVQAASLGSLASEVSALYGLRQGKLFARTVQAKTVKAAASAPLSVGSTDIFTEDSYVKSLSQLDQLRASAMSGEATRTIDASLGIGLSQSLGADSILGAGDWALAFAPSLWPVQGPVTSSYGQRDDPFNGEGAFHKGVDISSHYGTPVRAPADGTVVSAGTENGYGREVILNHGHGLSTLYGHLSGFTVSVGQTVVRGQIIGYVGTSGRSTGAHLHYEVRIHDTPVNPHKYLRTTMDEFVAHNGAL